MLVTPSGMTTNVRLLQPLKVPPSDACHAKGNGNGHQAAATLKSAPSDICHTAWNGDGRQITATVKSIRPDISHAVVDNHSGNASAAVVPGDFSGRRIIRHCPFPAYGKRIIPGSSGKFPFAVFGSSVSRFLCKTGYGKQQQH